MHFQCDTYISRFRGKTHFKLNVNVYYIVPTLSTKVLKTFLIKGKTFLFIIIFPLQNTQKGKLLETFYQKVTGFFQLLLILSMHLKLIFLICYYCFKDIQKQIFSWTLYTKIMNFFKNYIKVLININSKQRDYMNSEQIKFLTLNY